MGKQVIFTEKAPAPIGPYSQAVISNNMVYISGQIPINPATGQLVTGSIKAETEQVMQNLMAIINEAHITFEHVVKTSIFLSDMSYFAEVNEVYGAYFNSDFPARETVAVTTLPKNVNVEISMIAIMKL